MRMIRRRFAIEAIAMLVGLGGFAATGGALAAATPQRPAKTPKPCSLLTTSETSKILDIRVGRGRPRDIPSVQGLTTTRCDWESTKKGAGGVRAKPLQFQVTVATSDRAREVFERSVSADEANGIPIQPVPDLGTEAVYSVSSRSYSVLVVTSDTRLLFVRILAASLDTNKVDLNPEDALVAAAKLAAPRLEKG